jgi:hypothetical protein
VALDAGRGLPQVPGQAHEVVVANDRGHPIIVLNRNKNLTVHDHILLPPAESRSPIWTAGLIEEKQPGRDDAITRAAAAPRGGGYRVVAAGPRDSPVAVATDHEVEPSLE